MLAEVKNSLLFESYLWCAGIAFLGAFFFEILKEINKIKKGSFSKSHFMASIILGIIGSFVALLHLKTYGQEMTPLLYLNLGITAPTIFGTIAKSNADEIIKS